MLYATSHAGLAFQFCALDSATMSTAAYQAKVMIGEVGGVGL